MRELPADRKSGVCHAARATWSVTAFSFMKRHRIVILTDNPDTDELSIYIEANELKIVGSRRVIADGVAIDLPGGIIRQWAETKIANSKIDAALGCK